MVSLAQPFTSKLGRLPAVVTVFTDVAMPALAVLVGLGFAALRSRYPRATMPACNVCVVARYLAERRNKAWVGNSQGN